MKCVKMTDEDIEIIRENADRFEKGNFSEWVRRASKEYRPAKGSSDDFY